MIFLRNNGDSRRCSICGNQFDGIGSNSMPLKPGICCDDCNIKVVVTRLHELKKHQK